MTNTKKNYIYNLTLNVSNILFSIILLPVLSRRLGSEQIGIYSYTSSIAAYFMLFSLLGIQNYGNRLIASTKNDKQEKSRQFFSLYILQMIMSLLVIIVYLSYVFFCDIDHKSIALVQSIYLLSAMFDISWFFYGSEKFKPTSVVGAVTKFIYLVLTLIFVRDSGDLSIYVLIMGIYTICNNLFLFPLLKNNLVKVKITRKDIIKHLKPCLILFIPVIAVSIYKIMDKIMLGNIAGTTEVGFYEQAEKIISIPLQLVSALGVVMLPKMANIISESRDTDVKRYILKSLDFIMFLIIPIVLGLICISDTFVPLFLGQEFSNSSILLKGLAISVIFVTYGNVIRTHYIIPKCLDHILVGSVLSGAIINLILNILLIPHYAALGAVIATIVAEFMVVLYQTIYLWKNLEVMKYLKCIFIFIIKGVIMAICVKLVDLISLDIVYVKLFLQILIGVISYAFLNINHIKNLLQDIRFRH